MAIERTTERILGVGKLAGMAALLAGASACAHGPGPTKSQGAGESLRLSESVLRADQEKFIAHTGTGPFKNYLSQEIPYAPVKALFDDLEKRLGVKLKNRGEAHITVITPPEYDGALGKGVSMERINELAEARLQKMKFEVVCLGRGQAEVEGKAEQAYYVVVKSEDLVRFREEVFELYKAGGGEPSQFDPRHFYPHITVGFTKSDLHESQGVKKGTNSCWLPLQITTK